MYFSKSILGISLFAAVVPGASATGVLLHATETVSSNADGKARKARTYRFVFIRKAL